MMPNLSLGWKTTCSVMRNWAELIDEWRRIWDHRATSIATEVAGRSGSVLDGERVITSMPLQLFMFQPKGVSV